jgi:hypothetical protein
MADKHIGHGSQLVYRRQSLKLKSFIFLHAFFIATISACNVGSFSIVTRFVPVLIIL